MPFKILYTESSLRNFTYLLKDEENRVVCFDPFSAAQVQQFLQSWGGHLTTIINTHEHWDHTQGNEELVGIYQCEVLAHPKARDIPCQTGTLKKGDQLDLGIEGYLEVLETPGHTMAHLSFLWWKEQRPYGIFTGDTLFNAGVGNCHNGGDPHILYQTIKNEYYPLADEIIVFPGHEYLQNNLRFTLDREPHNRKARELLEWCEANDVIKEEFTTTMGLEKEINTFLRLSEIEIRNNLPQTVSSEEDAFVALRALRNQW